MKRNKMIRVACALSLIAMVLLLPAEAAYADEAKEGDDILRQYPDAKEGYIRYVINSQKIIEKDVQKIEVWAFKNIEVNCRKNKIGGEFNPKLVPGRGLMYWELDTNNILYGEKGKCGDDWKRRVDVRAKKDVIHLNRTVPVVVMVPEGWGVKYRVLREEKEEQASEG
jgi:ecotin